MTAPVRPYRGGEVSWDYGYYTATSPNYDASYEGEEDGWIVHGDRVSARTIVDLRDEVDIWIAEHSDRFCPCGGTFTQYDLCRRCGGDRPVQVSA